MRILGEDYEQDLGTPHISVCIRANSGSRKMRTLFAVVRTRGFAWDETKPMRSQEQWSEHAVFMNKLAADGFVVLGGPLDDDGDILLAINAADEGKIRGTLEKDPWTKSGILNLKSVQPWTILLDSTDK